MRPAQRERNKIERGATLAARVGPTKSKRIDPSLLRSIRPKLAVSLELARTIAPSAEV
jgi:hypothetical protein